MVLITSHALAHDARDDIACNVDLCRAKATATYYCICLLQTGSCRGHYAMKVVANLDLKKRACPTLSQLLADPGRIGVIENT